MPRAQSQGEVQPVPAYVCDLLLLEEWPEAELSTALCFTLKFPGRIGGWIFISCFICAEAEHKAEKREPGRAGPVL